MFLLGGFSIASGPKTIKINMRGKGNDMFESKEDLFLTNTRLRAGHHMMEIRIFCGKRRGICGGKRNGGWQRMGGRRYRVGGVDRINEGTDEGGTKGCSEERGELETDVEHA